MDFPVSTGSHPGELLVTRYVPVVPLVPYVAAKPALRQKKRKTPKPGPARWPRRAICYHARTARLSTALGPSPGGVHYSSARADDGFDRSLVQWAARSIGSSSSLPPNVHVNQRISQASVEVVTRMVNSFIHTLIYPLRLVGEHDTLQ